MVREDLYITVPSFFRCPISLDVMKSPVSLSTGVTYDRSSIQTWLENGNNTCPATMQVLQSKDFVPNHTLHRLIQTWSNSVQRGRVDSEPPLPPPSLCKDQARILIKEIELNPLDSLDSLTKLASFAKESSENRRFLARLEGFLPMIFHFLGNGDVRFAEQVVQILNSTVNEAPVSCELNETVSRKNRDFSSSILLVLQKGSGLDSKIASARVLENIAQKSAESKLIIAENDGLLRELLRFLQPETDSSLLEAILSCLISIAMPKRVKTKIVQLGMVHSLSKLLSDTNVNTACSEKVLKLLETVSSCKEGRVEICGDSACVAEILGKVLKVSKSATEHAVTILWSVCYLFRDQKAQDAVAMNNGLTKILLLMQSDCSPAVRQMSTDLLKIFRVSSKSCLSGYDTKASHIMPF